MKLKILKDYDREYIVSSDGRVFSTKTEEELKQFSNKKGYKEIALQMNGKNKMIRVNRLIAETFIPNPNNLPQVNHIDGNKTNNDVSNLEWCTCSYNIRHAFENGLYKKARRIKIVETGEEFCTIKQCAIEKHLVRDLITECVDGKRESYKGFHFEELGKEV